MSTFWRSYRLLAYSYHSLILCLRPKLAFYSYAYGSLVNLLNFLNYNNGLN